MNKELFGVFGGRDAFTDLRSEAEFDRVLAGDAVTVGVRDVALGLPGRTAAFEGADGAAVVWGEAFTPDARGSNTARWLLDQYAARGRSALGALNGSYVAVVDVDGDAVAATDPVRSWECFYADVDAGRVFGTDSTTVARCLGERTIDRQGALEFLYAGAALGEHTPFEELHRVPFDGCLTARDTDALERFVYDPADPASFDPVAELAERLERALARRARFPGRKGLLLSGGFDARLFLAGSTDVAECFTIGDRDSREVEVAAALADQYDAAHTVFEPARRYLAADREKTRYSQGIRESIHAHHAGYDDQMEVDTVYHGLLFDICLCGHFVPRRRLGVGNATVPLRRLDPDPEPVETLLDRFGVLPDHTDALAALTPLAEEPPGEFVRDAVRAEYEKGRWRASGVHNATELCGLRTQPALPFRTHLADNYLESLLVADRELVEWHLRTPPRYRTRKTFLEALARIDPDALRSRPPDRPHDHPVPNEFRRFLHGAVPGLEPFSHSLPHRRRVYEEHDLDREFFPDCEEFHPLHPRLKLRVHDLQSWGEQCVPPAGDAGTDGDSGPATETVFPGSRDAP